MSFPALRRTFGAESPGVWRSTVRVRPVAGGHPAGRLPEADGLRPVRRGPGRRPVRARRASLRLPRRAARPLARAAGAAHDAVDAARPRGATARSSWRTSRSPRSTRPRCAASSTSSRRSSDGLLVGEHANRPDFPPTMFAAEVIAAGGRVWTTLACRDRNRVVLEQELAGLAAVGVDGVLCVTGDGRGASVRPGVTQVFDLDGVRLAALAAGMGLPVAVPESPEAPPAGPAARPGRREAAGRRAALRAQPREQPGAGRRRSSPPRGPPGRRCRSSPGSPSTPTSRRRGCCSASPACTWTTRSWSACWPRRTRGPPASRPPWRRRGRCWRSRASSA